jgi:hypothetical protein
MPNMTQFSLLKTQQMNTWSRPSACRS